ncbi:50S ribosomal protein L25 [Tepidimicrobium xylanilyticum]|uniref:Large ribosomal subunit protein bL25 n=1 Tax=Tepidimicrobium xylanilyticum TaxID=1123352 RepID=A0A1H2WNA0_9FIRM|nr:50S ribosomal protein L25 [Tepidimicrobium xylanilyticum]GMG95201.1 50S ribosomal protein L25 [Tepidimicrobium xylanilyticum]SDW81744.1 large subunit ribosomal protein L25 [Tepidimicrobium xylanilyticum]
MAAIKLQAELRTGAGKNRANKIRREGFIPAVVYGKEEKTEHIKVDQKEFNKVYRTAGITTMIDLELDGKVLPVLIKEVQIHPFKNQFLHADFQKIKMDETIRLTIPITIVGKDNIRQKEGVLVQQLDEIEIECLPKYIPQSTEVDVSDIDFNKPVLVSDLNIFGDENITIFREADDVIATLVETAGAEAEEEEDVEEVDASDVPVVGKEEEE